MALLFTWFGWISFALAVLAIITIITFVAIGSDILVRLKYAFKQIDGHVFWDPIDDSIDGLPQTAVVPTEYSETVARYLLDQLARYMRLYTQQVPDWELRAGTTVVREIYTERGTQMSCVVMDDEQSKSTIVLFKGTTTKVEGTVDMAYSLGSGAFTEAAHQCTPNLARHRHAATGENVFIHSGFHDFYASMRTEIHDAILKGKRDNVYVCGHSLGAALATVCVYDLDYSNVRVANNVYGVTIGGPRVGNPDFAKYFEDRKLNLFQLRNSADVVPTIPPVHSPALRGKRRMFRYAHAGTGLLFYAGAENLLYAHLQITYQHHLKTTGLSVFREHDWMTATE